MKNTWSYKPCQFSSILFSSVQFSVYHKTPYKTAQIMPNLAGWRAGLLLLLLVLMLLLKPYMALVSLYCYIVPLYSVILIQLKLHMALVALYCCIIAPYSFILAQYGSCGSILRNCNIISHHSCPIWPHCGPICCLAGWLAACLAAWLAGWLPGCLAGCP